MIKVAGHWELSWSAPYTEAQLWNFPLRAYKVSDWYMWPVTGVIHNEQQKVTLHERATCEEILAENQDLQHVYLEPYNRAFPEVSPVSLIDFVHPPNVLYIFGSAHYNPALLHRTATDDVVMVPNIENSGVLWPHQVLVALLYDRLVKGWQSQ